MGGMEPFTCLYFRNSNKHIKGIEGKEALGYVVIKVTEAVVGPLFGLGFFLFVSTYKPVPIVLLLSVRIGTVRVPKEDYCS